MMLLRHLLSILLLPTMAAGVLPWWLLTAGRGADTRWPAVPIAWVPRTAGALVFAAGFGLFAWCVWLFARVGRGTLAPWDPTQALVAVGPYRYTRNPMITGVALMLTGEALVSGSALVGAWVVLFFVVNHLYFIVSEEPGLEDRFGEPYRAYCARVPRWLGRRHSGV